MYNAHYRYLKAGGISATFHAACELFEDGCYRIEVSVKGKLGIRRDALSFSRLRGRTAVLETIECSPRHQHIGSLLLKVITNFIRDTPCLSCVYKIVAAYVLTSSPGFYLNSGFHPSIDQKINFITESVDKALNHLSNT